MRSRLLLTIGITSSLAFAAEDPASHEPAKPDPVIKDAAAPPASDGWTGSRCSVTLFQASPIAPLVVQGMVPKLDSPPFAPTATVLVDHHEVMKRPLAPGNFEMRTLISGTTGTHLIEVLFDSTHPLPPPDGRVISAMIERIAIERVTDAPESWQLAAGTQDVVSPGAGVGLGDHWYAFETWQGQRFRWAGPGAEIGIASSNAGVLTVEVEAGPGITGKTGFVRLMDRDGSLVDKAPLGKRMAVDLLVSAAALAHQPFSLAVEGGGKPTPGEARVLDLRVFSLTYRSQP